MTDAAGRRLPELRGDLTPDDIEAGLDRDLRDASTHGAEPDDPDPLQRHPGRGAYTAASAVVVAAALDVVDARVTPEQERQRPDDEQEDDEDEFHVAIVACRYY